jgi:hypothetical protein
MSIDPKANIKAAVEGDELVLRININGQGPLSASEKSRLLANSGGFATAAGLPAGVKFSLNVIQPK